MRTRLPQHTQHGYSLVEVLILLFIFSSMFILMLTAFQNSIRNLNVSKAKIVAVEIANAQMEILRNLSYADLGTTTGSPSGSIERVRTINRSYARFTVTTDIIYVDDPYDGCAGDAGNPAQSLCADGSIVDKPRDIPANSNNPADYKKADVTVTWDPYYTGNPVQLSTIIAPADLEGDTDKGFLLIKVFDADGQPVSGASVHVTNSTVTPSVDITQNSDTFGSVLLLDLEPSVQTYQIVVTKSGYSTDRTCSEDDAGTACSDSDGVPDPVTKLVSVYQGEVEEAYFNIDQVSILHVNSYDENCVALPAIDFTLQSSLRTGQIGKKISYEPAPDGIVKTNIDFSTDGSGQWSKTDLEWDIYDLLIRTGGYQIAGINHNLSLNILPDTNTTLNVLLASATANALLVTVQDDSGTGLAGATVALTKTSDPGTVITTKVTGEGFVQQSDWSGGPGVDYTSDDGHIDYSTAENQVTLKKNNPTLTYSEDFSTGTYKDAANTDADWNTSDFELKLPTSGSPYPTNTHHAQTVTLNSQNGKIVSATLSGTEQKTGDHTINYFVSADGGLHYEAVTLNDASPHNFIDVGNDLRIRIELTTSNAATTPIIEDISLDYTIEYYDASGELISSTFDLGSAADFSNIFWQLDTQPTNTELKFQLAANDDNTTWNYIGPDGTGASYYTTNNADIESSLDGNTYFRYKALLSTSDVYYTPTMNTLRVGYTQACLPPGQVFFSGLDAEEYGLRVTLDGYQEQSYTVDVSGYTVYITNPPLTP